MTDAPIDDDNTPLRGLELLERELRQLVARLTTVAARSQAAIPTEPVDAARRRPARRDWTPRRRHGPRRSGSPHAGGAGDHPGTGDSEEPPARGTGRRCRHWVMSPVILDSGSDERVDRVGELLALRLGRRCRRRRSRRRLLGTCRAAPGARRSARRSAPRAPGPSTPGSARAARTPPSRRRRWPGSRRGRCATRCSSSPVILPVATSSSSSLEPLPIWSTV